MSNTDWTKPQRQAPAGLILFFGDNFRKIIRMFFPVFIGVVLHKGDGDNTVLYIWAVIILLFLVSLSAVLSYLYFKFSIVNDEFVLQKGFFRKVRLTIPLERIQTINIKQNIIQKILGVVSLEVDTAGAANAEVKLKAINYRLAKELEKELKNSSDKKSTHEPLPKKEDDRIILKLNAADLFKISITENHFRSFLLILVFVNWIYTQIKDFYNEEVKRLAKEGMNSVEKLDFSLWIWLFVFMVLVSVMISFIRVFLRYYDFNLSHAGNTFIVEFGLFNRREINVPISKIQLLEEHINPLRKLLDFRTLVLKQASSDDIKRKQAVAIPACRKWHLKLIESIIFRDTGSEFTRPLYSHPVYFIRGFVFYSLAVLALSVFASEMLIMFSWWMFTAVEFVLAFLFYLAGKKRSFRFNDVLIQITKGMIGTSTYRMASFKIQGVKFRQSVFQKMRKRAGITIYTASGDELNVPYIDEKQARDIFNYLLYKIESSDKPWM
ncbi:MAG: PH domain-containing protein [Chlorobi bacterium]|nr:PH domain-containing protein [Chlorobiota bacterium]